MQKLILLFLTIFISHYIYGQKPQKPSSAEIYNQIQKLNFLGSVLYIAAHPDDENTKLIAYLANEKKARTAYLSLTRGDGGQNLIGPELRELLGVIRTQELIEARKIDGGEQFFSRANDFGFSKNPDETLNIWDKNQVLSDVVWIIRKFQPDVIINRFDHRTPGTTHGHHTSSAMLSVEAFDKTNDPKIFPEHLSIVKPWQAKRLYFNTSWWFYGSKEKFDKANKSDLAQIKTGVYYNTIGKSNQEIAALSRSSHQSQGFGNTGTRGEEYEYLEFCKGISSQDKNNIFEGIDTSWNRVKGGKTIGDLVTEIEKNFDFKNPSASIPNLLKVYELIQGLDDIHWKNIKTDEIKKIIAACAGLYLEASTDTQEATINSTLKVKLEAINRSEVKMNWKSCETYPAQNISLTTIPLENNIDQTKNIDISLQNVAFSSPYWLKEKGTVGMYQVTNQNNRGIPDILRQIKVIFNIEINGTTIPFERYVIYKYNDDVKGEVYQPLDIVPLVTTSITEKVYLFNNENPKTIQVKVKAGKDNINATAKLNIPTGWEISPKETTFNLKRKGEEELITFTVKPSKELGEFTIKSLITINNEVYDKEQININYNHIYKQVVLKEAEAKALKLNLKTNNERIAYMMGVGDEVPKSLLQMGYSVTIIKPEDISTQKLNEFDVVITGIRAYNVVNALAFKQSILLDFVKNGKTMIVQYNTLDDLVTQNIGPFPIKISKDRVTEENAKVKFLAPEHPILNTPNKITIQDFEGWKQEQGLYYPNEYDNNYTPIIESNDKGESSKKGAILVAKYGSGNYIYTGLSFFRELPEGVTGAYRIIANMISIGK